MLVKVDELNEEKRELERELDVIRLKGVSEGSADGLRDTVSLLEKEREVMREE